MHAVEARPGRPLPRPRPIHHTRWPFISNARARSVGWRLDYLLVSQPLAERVQDVVIHDDIPGSDHCPVSRIL